jgi:hypothetical protein
MAIEYGWQEGAGRRPPPAVSPWPEEHKRGSQKADDRQLKAGNGHPLGSCRLIKSPKLHFTDSGLATHLAGVTSLEHGRDDRLRGRLLETYARVRHLPPHPRVRQDFLAGWKVPQSSGIRPARGNVSRCSTQVASATGRLARPGAVVSQLERRRGSQSLPCTLPPPEAAAACRGEMVWVSCARLAH